jgi:hypothetical protein
MNHDKSPRHHLTPSDATTCAITASGQWHDAELAMTVARHSFDRWLVTGHQDTPSLAIMHAHHTHTAVHEAVRAITTLIDTLGAEMTALITTPPQRTDIPTQRR